MVAGLLAFVAARRLLRAFGLHQMLRFLRLLFLRGGFRAAVTVFDGYVKNRSSRRAHAILWRCAYRAVHPCASGTQFVACDLSR